MLRTRSRLGLVAGAALTLTAVTAAPGQAGQAGQDVYVANFNSSGEVVVAPVGGTGAPGAALIPVATTGGSNQAVALTPTGDQLFTNNDLDLVSFPIDGATGRPGTPTAVGAGAGIGVAVTPNGRFVYQVGSFDTEIYGFRLAGGGAPPVPLAGSPTTTTHAPVGIAISPDGRFLYTANTSSDSVGAFSIGSTGALTELPGSPFASAASPYAISITPDGRYLYVPGRNGSPQQVFGYVVAPDGTLTPAAGSPTNMAGTASNSFGSSVTADGRFFVTANYDSSNLSSFAIGAGGALTEVPGSPFVAPVGSATAAVTSDADGSHVYVTDGAGGGLNVFSVGDTGALAPIAGSPFDIGESSGDFQSVALTPDQPPVARLAVVRRAGKKVIYDASASTDPDSTVASYRFDFGDGKSRTTTTPKVTHTYARRGAYTVSVTVADTDGCSTTFTSSGQTAFCNGGSGARATTKVLVPMRLKVSAPRGQRLGRPVAVKVRSEKRAAVSARGTLTLVGASKKAVAFKVSKGKARKSGRITLKLRLSPQDAAVARGARSGAAKVKVVARKDGGRITRFITVRLT